MPSGRSSASAGGVSVMGKAVLGSQDDLRYSATVGKGIGRYIGLANVAADGMFDANHDIEARRIWAGYIAWHHAFDARLRMNLMLARNGIDNDLALTGPTANKYTESAHINLFYSPLPKVDLGAEYTWGRHVLENDADGKLQRLQFTAKYSF